MKCEMISKLLQGYLDDELDLPSIINVESHVEACEHCRKELQDLTRLRTEIRNKMSYHKASDSLQIRLQQAIGNIENKKKKPHWIQTIFTIKRTPSLAITIGLLFLAINLSLLLSLPSKQDSLSDEVVSSHIRSLLTDHLTDIDSSDRHTVKPWFNGKLNFAPQVIDLTSQGYLLVGGRLDYLDSRAVTALIYRRRQHLINVFIWPENTHEFQAEFNRTLNGYNLTTFISKGMNYWIVSDLNTKELMEFKRLLQ